jgi:hypothetical protein
MASRKSSNKVPITIFQMLLVGRQTHKNIKHFSHRFEGVFWVRNFGLWEAKMLWVRIMGVTLVIMNRLWTVFCTFSILSCAFSCTLADQPYRCRWGSWVRIRTLRSLGTKSSIAQPHECPSLFRFRIWCFWSWFRKFQRGWADARFTPSLAAYQFVWDGILTRKNSSIVCISGQHFNNINITSTKC